MKRVPLSVLDLSPIASGKTPADALACTVDLAVHAESLGYTRYWLAEHHNAKSMACSSPDVLAAVVAARTSRIRVGSGGVMLPNHSPLRVAEAFRTLSGLFPGRIDLGLGRAPGSDGRTARALRRMPSDAKLPPPEAMDDDLRALLGFLADDAEERGPFATTIVAVPSPVVLPAVHVLGSSTFGASLAAKHGLPFAFAHHFAPADAVDSIRVYRNEFVPGEHAKEPRVILAVSAQCADTDEEAKRLAQSGRLRWLQFTKGLRDLPLPSVEEAEAYDWTEEDRALVPDTDTGLVGSAATVKAKLEELRSETNADELMITTATHDHAARRRSYELLIA